MSKMRTFWLGLLSTAALALGCAQRSTTVESIPVAPTSEASALSLAAAPDQFFTSNDARIRYRVIGGGEPVVLLHGFTRSLADWYGLADSIARDHRVIALDFRGFGKSSKFTDASRYGDAMSDDVMRLLDHLQLERAHLVGHSMGAAVAAELAVRYPERVRSLTLAAGPFRDPAELAQQLAPTFTALQRGGGIKPLIEWLFPTLPDSIVAAMNAETMANNDAAVLLAVLSSPRTVVNQQTATALRVPALAIVGDADPLREDSRLLASWSQRVRLVVVPGANHGDITFRPEFLAALRAQLTPN